MVNSGVPRKGWSVFERCLAGFIIANVAVLAAFSAVYYLHCQSLILHSINDHISQARHSRVQEFEAKYVARVARDLYFARNAPATANLLSSSKAEEMMARTEVERFFLELSRSNATLLSTRFIDYAGMERAVVTGSRRARSYQSLLVSTPDSDALTRNLRELVLALTHHSFGEIACSALFASGDGHFGFLAGVAVADPEAGTPGGFIVQHYDFSPMIEDLRRAQLFGVCVAWALTPDGVAVVEPPPGEVRFDPRPLLAQPGATEHALMSVVECRMTAGTPAILTIVFSVPPQVVSQRLKPLLWQTLGVAGLMGLVSLLLAWRISRRIAGPIVAVSQASKAIGKGALETRVPESAGGEIGELAHSFNRMIEDLQGVQLELRQANERLEARVSERTQELCKANDTMKNTNAVLSARTDEVERQAAELVSKNEALRLEVLERTRAEIDRQRVQEDLTLTLRGQEALSALLRLALERGTLETQLQRALDQILALSWMPTVPKGAILLLNSAQGVLELKVHRNLAPEILSSCSTVPLGRCLCGRAAMSRQIQYATRVDERHEVAYNGMPEHGHFNVPIVSGDATLGVLVLYLAEGHRQDERQTAFLETAASTLASLILHKRAEDELRASKERVQSVLEAVSAGILIVDAQSRQIVSANPAATAMLGITSEQAIGRVHESFYPAEDGRCPEFGQPFDKARRVLLNTGSGRLPVLKTVTPVQMDGREMRLESFVDISDLERAERELAELNKKMLDSAREAGMAEVASSVLHNVGNVLNSVNISVSVIQENLRQSRIVSLAKATSAMRDHLTELPAFLSCDPKGKQIPGFLIALSEQLNKEHATLENEISDLVRNIDHIKQIVSLQQSFATSTGLAEITEVQEVVESAIEINGASMERHDVRITRTIDTVSPVVTQKHKLLQILVNLISNAKYAVVAAGRLHGEIAIRVVEETGENVRVDVTDNGIGIPRENLVRIFTFGFTTRKDGHGFGLHASALAAKQIGGVLTVHSDGADQGASFTLRLPRKRVSD